MRSRLRVWLAVAVLGLMPGACTPTPARIHKAAGEATVQGYTCLTPPCYAADNRQRLTDTYENKTFKGNETRNLPWSHQEEWKDLNRDGEGSPPRLCMAMTANRCWTGSPICRGFSPSV